MADSPFIAGPSPDETVAALNDQSLLTASEEERKLSQQVATPATYQQQSSLGLPEGATASEGPSPLAAVGTASMPVAIAAIGSTATGEAPAAVPLLHHEGGIGADTLPRELVVANLPLPPGGQQLPAVAINQQEITNPQGGVLVAGETQVASNDLLQFFPPPPTTTATNNAPTVVLPPIPDGGSPSGQELRASDPYDVDANPANGLGLPAGMVAERALLDPSYGSNVPLQIQIGDTDGLSSLTQVRFTGMAGATPVSYSFSFEQLAALATGGSIRLDFYPDDGDLAQEGHLLLTGIQINGPTSATIEATYVLTDAVNNSFFNNPSLSDNSAPVPFSVAVTDSLGSTTEASTAIVILDDVPVLPGGGFESQGDLSSQDPSTSIPSSASFDYSAAFVAQAQIQASIGADSSGNSGGSLVGLQGWLLSFGPQALAITVGGTSVVDSQLTSGGETVYLLQAGDGTLLGETHHVDGSWHPVFSLAVDSRGLVTLTQFGPIDQGGQATASLASGLVELQAMATINDGDFDAASAVLSTDLGGSVHFASSGATQVVESLVVGQPAAADNPAGGEGPPLLFMALDSSRLSSAEPAIVVQGAIHLDQDLYSASAPYGGNALTWINGADHPEFHWVAGASPLEHAIALASDPSQIYAQVTLVESDGQWSYAFNLLHPEFIQGQGDVALQFQLEAQDSQGGTVHSPFSVTVAAGSEGPDTILVTQPGNHAVTALGGDDWIHAGPGDDAIRGGPGNDGMAGGDGHDAFVFAKGDSSGDPLHPDHDQILDLAAGEHLIFTGDAHFNIETGNIDVHYADGTAETFHITAPGMDDPTSHIYDVDSLVSDFLAMIHSPDNSPAVVNLDGKGIAGDVNDLAYGLDTVVSQFLDSNHLPADHYQQVEQEVINHLAEDVNAVSPDAHLHPNDHGLYDGHVVLPALNDLVNEVYHSHHVDDQSAANHSFG